MSERDSHHATLTRKLQSN